MIYCGSKEILGQQFFDPERSTTHDVVRHAIIPMTLQGKLPTEENQDVPTEHGGVTKFERHSCIKPAV